MSLHPSSRDPARKGPPRYRLSQVAAAMAVVYVLLALFDARGLYRWTQKLPVTDGNARLRKSAATHWERMASFGLEEPKHTLETRFLDLQEAHPLLYPRKHADMAARKREKEKRKAVAAAAAADAKIQAAKLPPWSRREMLAKDAKRPRVLLAGDSIMAGIGPVIKKDVATKLAGTAVVRARVSTGLARPDVFDWREELREATSGSAYDAIVLMLGTNDSQDFVEGGRIMSYGTTDWVRVYERRLDDLMRTACKAARKAIWIGLPPMQSAAFHRKAVRINALAQRRAARHACFEYLPLERVIGDERGSFVSYLQVGPALEKVRNVDGIHITQQGGSLVSWSLLTRLQ